MQSEFKVSSWNVAGISMADLHSIISCSQVDLLRLQEICVMDEVDSRIFNVSGCTCVCSENNIQFFGRRICGVAFSSRWNVFSTRRFSVGSGRHCGVSFGTWPEVACVVARFPHRMGFVNSLLRFAKNG